MGKLRARTEAEFAARREEILEAAGQLLMTQEYDAVSLTAIAEKTSISRPSMYNYYETRELVFADLMLREYEKWRMALLERLSEPQSREKFCEIMVDILWEREILLKLLSLQLSVWDHRYSEDTIIRFQHGVVPFAQALYTILKIQFPSATDDAINQFRIQFTVYCNSLYALAHLPQCQMQALEDTNVFGSIPAPRQISFEGLMLLTSNL